MSIIYKVIGCISSFLFIFFLLSNTTMDTPKNDAQKVIFQNVASDTLKRAFLEVFQKYQNLHPYKIYVSQKRMGATTMKAQPVFNFKGLLKGEKAYKVEVGVYLKDTNVKLSEVPFVVLKGWFAHELGHIADYENRSSLGMLWYAVKYITSSSFKRKVEHTADYIALKKGFKKELLETKRYILLSELFSEKYLKNIHKYYLPIKEVQDYIDENDEVTLSKMYHE